VANWRELPILYGGALMTEQNDNQAIDVFSRKWLLIVILCGVPIFFLFAVMGDPGRGRAAGISVAVGMTAIRACWNLRNHVWFWVTVAIMIGLHTLLIVLVHWTSASYPAFSLLPVALSDYGIVYGSFKLVEKVMRRRDEAISSS
jgi:hypothetical protein